jgi:hypothetical protein
MRTSFLPLVWLAGITCFAASSPAAIVVTNFPGGSASQSTYNGGPWNAQGFLTSATAFRLESIQLLLSGLGGGSGFSLSLFGDNGQGAPSDTLLASFTRSGIGNEIAIYTFAAQGEVILPAHTTLWLVVKSSDLVSWYQSEGDIQGEATMLSALRKNGTEWTPTNGSFTIRIEGTAVPEPSASLLLAMGLGSALMWRRRYTC